MTTISQKFGTDGENAAADFLIGKGYEIMEKNWRYRNLEVDIIAVKNTELVIVEVKSRANTHFGEPELFVTRQKQRNLIKAASAYIEKTNFKGNTRFDIIAVTINNNNLSVKHIENAFYPSII